MKRDNRLWLVLAALGYTQWQQLSLAWPDARPTTAFLSVHMTPGDRVLSNESWPYTVGLYAEGLIDSPRSRACLPTIPKMKSGYSRRLTSPQ